MTPSTAWTRSAWHLIHHRGSPGPSLPRSPFIRGCCDDVRTVIGIKTSVIFFLMCVWFIHQRTFSRGKRGRCGSSVGRKWESEWNRCSGSWRGIVKIQVSGMKSPAIRTLLAGAAVWRRRESRLASARTLSPDFFCQTHILGHIHVG